jgi:sulfate adenylyltransferase
LIPPHGSLPALASATRAAELKALACRCPSWDLNERQLCDLELLLNGGFAPLAGFLGRRDYESVVERMRLSDGTLWPIPVTLDVSAEVAARLGAGETLALRDGEGALLAALEVESVWEPDLAREARLVYGTDSPLHPGVAYLSVRSHRWYVGGRLTGIALPSHHDFTDLRRTPADLRSEFQRDGWRRIVAFQTRNPLHRAHYELTLRAAAESEAKLLIHPVAGPTKPGDLDHYTRASCYRAVLSRYPRGSAKLALLPLAMRMAGPREALWHAIIRKNHGCTHLIVGRDHAGPGTDTDGRPFYPPYAAQELLRQHEAELGVQLVPFPELVYVESRRAFLAAHEVPRGEPTLSLSGTELRRRLAEGDALPEWFTFPEVADQLRRRHPPRERQGLTVFFTGLSGAGKSTIANVLLANLLELGGRPVTLLDGDLLRKHLSSELGFSKEHRDLHIRRIGFFASEITRHGGIALCAPIAPYDATRKEVRRMVEEAGGFLLVHVSTPLAVCEERDRKGLYARARAGAIDHFTGISDPYEEPEDADLVIETTEHSPQQAAQAILDELRRRGYLGAVHGNGNGNGNGLS